MTDLSETKRRLGCLVPKPGVEMPSSHEYTLCDCEALELVEEIERLRKEVLDWKGTHAHQCTESSIRIGGLEQSLQRTRGLLEECEKALEWEDRRCGKVFGPLGEALAKLRASRGES